MASYRETKRQVLREVAQQARMMSRDADRPEEWEDPDSPNGERWERACEELARELEARAGRGFSGDGGKDG